MEIGIDSFAEAKQNNGRSYSENSAQSISELLDRIEHADKVGLDVFGIGEHYRREFLDSANSVILSAAASRTKNILLTSAVTVLSAADPVRAFQNFATLDLVSSGRAEMVVGRGSFTESYPLFGLNLNEYDDIFSEKLDLLFLGVDFELLVVSKNKKYIEKTTSCKIIVSSPEVIKIGNDTISEISFIEEIEKVSGQATPEEIAIEMSFDLSYMFSIIS